MLALMKMSAISWNQQENKDAYHHKQSERAGTWNLTRELTNIATV